jgi:hypothetical protein
MSICILFRASLKRVRTWKVRSIEVEEAPPKILGRDTRLKQEHGFSHISFFLI